MEQDIMQRLSVGVCVIPDIWLAAANVICGLFLTGIGIVMVINPPGEVRWKKNLYLGLFLVFGAASVVITVEQTDRTAKQQEKAAKEAQQEQLDSQGKLSYMQGTLVS
jgi:hypothetical protein